MLANHPQDLEPILFLASNKVAPPHANVQLGIGESILIKAIVQASKRTMSASEGEGGRGGRKGMVPATSFAACERQSAGDCRCAQQRSLTLARVFRVPCLPTPGGQTTGRTAKGVKDAYDEEGDLGLVAEKSRSTQRQLAFAAKPKPLLISQVIGKAVCVCACVTDTERPRMRSTTMTRSKRPAPCTPPSPTGTPNPLPCARMHQVLTSLRKIAEMEGNKSQDKKIQMIQRLLRDAKGPEARFIIRALQGKLRIGLAETTVLIALAHAVLKCPPRNLVPW